MRKFLPYLKRPEIWLPAVYLLLLISIKVYEWLTPQEPIVGGFFSHGIPRMADIVLLLASYPALLPFVLLELLLPNNIVNKYLNNAMAEFGFFTNIIAVIYMILVYFLIGLLIKKIIRNFQSKSNFKK